MTITQWFVRSSFIWAWDRTCSSESREVLWLKILHSNTQQQVTPYPVEHATCKVQTCDIILGNKDFMFVLLSLIPISSLKSWTSIIMDSFCLLWQINKDLNSEYLIMKCNILIHTEHNRRTDQNRRWENIKKKWIWKSRKVKKGSLVKFIMKQMSLLLNYLRTADT